MPVATLAPGSAALTYLYIAAFALFIYGIMQGTHPTTAKRGNAIAAVGMAIAIVATLLRSDIEEGVLIAVGIAVGTAVGVPAARNVKMTAMPQMVALFNGVGGGAVALISWSEYRESLAAGGNPDLETLIPLLFAAIIGSISFWGSNIAFGKLQELIPGRPIQLPGQQFVNAALLLVAVGCAVAIASGTESQGLFILILVAAAILGNMDVLLAEADVPYDHLKEMDEINPEFPYTDVALVIGANDVTNPAAREQENSPIYGMPILDVDKAGQVIVLKRSMNPGFAGIDNPLFYNENTALLFGDAKESVSRVLAEVKEL